MKKLIVASMIVMMTATAGVVSSPIIATGLTELIADELIVDETQSEHINVAYQTLGGFGSWNWCVHMLPKKYPCRCRCHHH